MSADNNAAPAARKRWYRRIPWWGWVAIVVVVVIAAVAGGGGGSDKPTADATSTASPDSGTSNDSTSNDPQASEAPARDNSTAVAATLGAGEFTVGQDVQPGRYVITAPDGQTGNISVDRASELMPWVNEILGTAHGIGVPSVTTDLKDGDTIKISGLSAVTFTPAQTTLSTTLGAGRWTVGIDIPAGRYTATPAEGETGNISVDRDGKVMPVVNEILGTAHGIGVPSVTTDLKDGDTIKISGLSAVTFS